jgi:predicted nucleic acid-binding protein
LIPYLDSSALVKLLIQEPGSDVVWAAVGAVAPVTSRITYAEARAALARRERELTLLHEGDWTMARDNLVAYWRLLRVIEVTQPVVEMAGDLADTFGLRGYDAVQLASAQQVAVAGGEDLCFVSFDRRLNRAAHVLGMSLVAQGPR